MEIRKIGLVFFAFVIFAFAFAIFVPVSYAETADERKARLQQELIEVEKEIAKQQTFLRAKQQESGSIERDIAILDSEIKSANLQIRAKNIAIEQLGKDINLRSQTISELEEKIARGKESLFQLLQKTETIDSYSLVEVVLGSENMSTFFEDYNSFQSIKNSLHDSFVEIRSVKEEKEKEKQTLAVKKDSETDAKQLIENQKRFIEVKEKEKQALLAMSKSQERTYEQIISQRQAQANAIRAELIQFQGSGVQNRSISFGEAYDYAKDATAKTGVRTSFILAIMQQETGGDGTTEFGNNVGGCYLRNGETGEGVYIRSGNQSIRNMVPGNFDNFVKITSSLGMDWRTTPISCVYIRPDGTPYGYGGAMGFTQFIPNTWMDVEARVRSYLNIDIANPWNPQHAVMATAVFLRDRGAQSQTYTAEYNAACRYYGACSSYAASVMKKAADIQLTIEKLEQFAN